MAEPHAESLASQWAKRFHGDTLASSIVAGLKNQADQIWQRAFDSLREESPEYRNAVDDKFTVESKTHCNELLQTIVAIAAGRAGRSATDPFEFVRTHAQWRARHQVPLAASLHAYRIAHRTYWGITRESLVRHPEQSEALGSLAMLSDFWIELFDHVGAVLAEAHAVEEGLIVAQGSKTYVALIDDLLSGCEPRDEEARRLCAVCGVLPPSAMAVLVARPLRSGNGQVMDVEVTLRSLVRFLEQELPSATFGKLVDIRDGEVVMIACSAGDTARDLLKILRKNSFSQRAAKGLSAGVGVSLNTGEFDSLPEACREARLALEVATAKRPLVHFSELDLTEFLLRNADAAAVRLLPGWTHPFGDAEDDQAARLLRTLRTFADCSLNVKRTAQRLGVHANTVYFRLNQISKLTKVDARSFSGISFLLTALRLLELRDCATKRPQ